MFYCWHVSTHLTVYQYISTAIAGVNNLTRCVCVCAVIEYSCETLNLMLATATTAVATSIASRTTTTKTATTEVQQVRLVVREKRGFVFTSTLCTLETRPSQCGKIDAGEYARALIWKTGKWCEPNKMEVKLNLLFLSWRRWSSSWDVWVFSIKWHIQCSALFSSQST